MVSGSAVELRLLFLLAATSCSLVPQTTATTIQVTGLDPEHSLQHYLCNASGGVESGTTLFLSSGQHALPEDTACMVADVSNLVIRGVGSASIVCTSSLMGSNLIFLNISNLTLDNIKVENCGRVLPPDLPSYVNNTVIFIHTKQKATMVMSHVTNLQIVNFVVTQSFGFGIIGVNLKGDAMLHNVTISNTDNYRHPMCHGNETDMSCSGSGIVLIYTDPINEDEFTLSDTSLTITDSTFISNENMVPINQFIPVFLSVRGSFTLDRLLLTGASALGVYFGQRQYNVEIDIYATTISDNRGYASGVAFLLFNTVQNVHVLVDGCKIQRNEGTELARGGGLVMLVISYISELTSFNESLPGVHQLLTVTNTSFVANYADIAGAAYFYISPQNISEYGITFDNVTFEANQARIGTVFQTETRPATFVTKSLHFLLQDVLAIGNALPTSLLMATTTSENSAAFVFLSVFNITISGRNHTHGSLFSSNSPGAFLVVGGNLYLQGNVEFVNNTALRGGALSLYDFALLFIVEGSRIKFTQNTAVSVGGAIFSSSPGSGTSPTCVFQVIGPHRVFSVTQVHELDLRMQFVGNTATDGGNSIYVNPLYGCATIPESSLVDTSVVFDTSVFYHSIFDFVSSVNNTFTEIASIPERICYCLSDNVNNPEVLCAMRTISITVVSGQQFSLHLFPVDLNYNPVSSILFIDISSTSHTLGRGQASSQLRGGKCTILDFNLHGPANTTVGLTLHSQQGTAPAWVNVQIEECPPGFIAVEQDHFISCICDPFVTDIVGSTCNFTTNTISRPSNANSTWLGVVENKNFSDVVYVRTCPIGLCNRSLNSVDLTVKDYLCNEGRTGILCGACKANLSVVFGSPECRECSHFWLFTIFLYAVAGIVLVCFLFFLNFTVAQGTINGISVIFYVNLVSLNSNLLFSADNRGFLFIWVSILNLELGFPLCFYDGMTEAAKAGLQCIFPVYLLLLCIMIIYFSRWFKSIAKLISINGIHVLATLVYLSFSKMLRYVIDIFSVSTLISEERRDAIWLHDGNLGYFKGPHAIIVIFPAGITLIFIILYTLLMVFIKQVEKFTIKAKPLLDAYGGPFKDPYRFWFGARLLVLVCMCVTYAVFGSDNPLLAVIIQQIFLVLFMVIQAFLRPFKSQRMNALDLFFMLDLFFIFLYMVRVSNVTEAEQTSVINTFVSLAFILFILLICYHIYRIPKIRTKLGPKMQKFKDPTWWSEMPSRVCARCWRPSGEETETKDVQNDTMLKSMKSIDGQSVDDTKGNSVVSSTVVTLDSSTNADLVLRRELASKYTKCRESLIDDY